MRFITTDTAHAVVTAATTRENFYVAMTRGRDANHAHVTTDHPNDTHAQSHPSDDSNATAQSVIYGVLQHVGAELSAHEALRSEQDRWGSIAQLAAEYDTIAQAAQHDRWTRLFTTSGLTSEYVDDIVGSDAYGALSAELRRAEANHYDLDTLLPRIIASRELDNVLDLASVIHERLARVTARPAGSGRTHKPPLLVAGLIPQATGLMTAEMQAALDERRRLIRERAVAVLNDAITTRAIWVSALGKPPTPALNARVWEHYAQTVAAYRDRYLIDTEDPLGSPATSTAQKIDAARARVALDLAHRLSGDAYPTNTSDVPSLATGPEPRAL